MPAPGLPEEDDRTDQWRTVGLRLLVALLVLGGVYLGVALWFKDRPPAGVNVDGVHIGTMSRDAAREHLEESLAERLEQPVPVRVVPDGAGPDQATTLQLDPSEAGLGYDLDATLDQVTGFSLNPADLWSHVVGSERELRLVGTVDRESLTAAVRALAADYDTEPVEGEVSLTGSGVEVVDAADGRELDVEETVEVVAREWPARDEVQGSAEAVAPRLTQQEVERFTREEVEPALAGPVLVTASQGKGEDAEKVTAELAPREIAALLSVDRPGDGSLTLSVDQKALLARLREDLGQLERGPSDATVRLSGGAVKVVPARSGAALDEKPLLADVTEAISARGKERRVSTTLKAVKPEISTAVAKEWTFTEMAEFTSVFPTGELNAARTANLRTGVKHLDGDVVMPGEQFALSRALGEITEQNGYHEAPIIVDGALVMGMGGGLSQISTVIFNTSWFAGVQLDAHTPHSYYIPRYPAGREATLALPGLDNVWTNDTDNPIVIRAGISGDTITMRFLGDRQYTVQTVDGPRHSVTKGEKKVDDSPECVPQKESDGFTISNVRILLAAGREVSRDEFTTVYKPADEIECSHPDAGY
ncbi:VanW family protein [Ornithinimicrobium tianjinense]